MNSQKNPSGFAKNAKCLKTDAGYCVNYHGTIFFVSNSFVYRPWVCTIKKGVLPPTVEYGRLKNEVKLVERRLTDFEEKQCKKIAETLQKNPLFMVPRKKESVQKVTAGVVVRMTSALPTTFAGVKGFEKLQQIKFG